MTCCEKFSLSHWETAKLEVARPAVATLKLLRTIGGQWSNAGVILQSVLWQLSKLSRYHQLREDVTNFAALHRDVVISKDSGIMNISRCNINSATLMLDGSVCHVRNESCVLSMFMFMFSNWIKRFIILFDVKCWPWRSRRRQINWTL